MKRAGARAVPFPSGAAIFSRVFTRIGLQGRPPEFHAEFFPYAGLTHTIRLRREVVYARLSPAMRRAPMAAQEAVAAILLSKLYRRRVPTAYAQAYRAFSQSAATQREVRRIRRARSRRVLLAPAGRAHDLRQMFSELNARYFAGGLRQPALGWSAQPWRRQLGCFDHALRQIVINQRLDQEQVPAYAVGYVLYHEMLHLRDSTRSAGCGLRPHSPEFRRQERQYHDYARALSFLRRRW